MVEKAIQIIVLLSGRLLIYWGWLANIFVENSIHQLLVPNAHVHVTIKITS